MAIAYKSSGAGAGTETNGASLNLVCPATVDANDILIAHVLHTGTSTAPSTPDGWSLLYGPADVGTTATARHWVFGKLAAGTEDGATVGFGTDGGTNGRAGRIYSFSGYSSGSLADVVPSASFSSVPHATDPQGPTVTTTVAGALAVALTCQDDNNTEEAIAGASGGTWAGFVTYVNATWGPQGVHLDIQVATPTSDPGTISGGAMVAANDESGTIGFEIRPAAPSFSATGALTLPAATVTGTATRSGAVPPVLESASQAGTSASTDTLTIGKPSGLAEGDLMLAVLNAGAAGGAPTWSRSGWTRLTPAVAYPVTDILWRVADAADVAAANFAFTLSASTTLGLAGGIARISGADTTSPIAAQPNESNGTSATPDPPASGSVTSGAYLALAIWGADNDRSSTPPADYTERIDATDGGGLTATAYLASRALEGITSEDPGAGALASSAGWKSYTLLIAPAASGHVATGTLSLPAATVSGTGSQALSATGALTTPAVVIDGTATAANPVSATGALALASVTVAGTGSQAHASTGALALPASTVAGTADYGSSASGALALPALAIVGTGAEAFEATGAVDLASIVIDGTAAAVQPAVATGALTLPTVTIAGTGEFVTADVTGTGALTLPAATVTGAGSQAHESTGALALPASTVSGTATQTHEATGALVLAVPTLDGTGAFAISGTGAVSLPAAVIEGTGALVPALTATGDLTLGSVVVSGVGDNGDYVAPPLPVGGRRRYIRPQPAPPPALVATGALSLPAVGVSGSGRQWDDDLWLYLEPALYIAGVT